MTEQDVAELEAVEAELLFRLRGIQRAALLRAGSLQGDDVHRIHEWGHSLAVLHK